MHPYMSSSDDTDFSASPPLIIPQTPASRLSCVPHFQQQPMLRKLQQKAAATKKWECNYSTPHEGAKHLFCHRHQAAAAAAAVPPPLPMISIRLLSQGLFRFQNSLCLAKPAATRWLSGSKPCACCSCGWASGWWPQGPSPSLAAWCSPRAARTPQS